MRTLVGIATGVAVGWFLAHWLGAFDPPRIANDSSKAQVGASRGTTTGSAEPMIVADVTAQPTPVDEGAPPAQDETEAPAQVSPPTLPFGCFQSLDDMPPLLRQEAADIVGEDAAAAFQILYFGEYELRTVQIQPIPESSASIESNEVVESTADWVAALDARETLTRRYVEDADFRNEGSRFATLEAARAFAEQSEHRVTRRSLVSDGFVVVDVRDLITRSDYRNATVVLDECRAEIRRQGLLVSSYGYNR